MKKIIFFIILLSLLCTGVAQFALAQAMPTDNQSEIQRQLGAAAGSQGANLGQPSDPRYIAAIIIRTALGLLGTIFLVLCIYGGFLWMTAAGSEEKVTKAKKLLFDGVIGIAIILAAYSITWLAFRIALGVPDNPFAPGSYLTVPSETIYTPNY
jgi:hypothetical protein